jgi:hypothetical protein
MVKAKGDHLLPREPESLMVALDDRGGPDNNAIDTRQGGLQVFSAEESSGGVKQRIGLDQGRPAMTKTLEQAEQAPGKRIVIREDDNVVCGHSPRGLDYISQGADHSLSATSFVDDGDRNR